MIKILIALTGIIFGLLLSRIAPEELKFYDINMDYVGEPGEFAIMVGNSSRDEDLKTTILTVI